MEGNISGKSAGCEPFRARRPGLLPVRNGRCRLDLLIKISEPLKYRLNRCRNPKRSSLNLDGHDVFMSYSATDKTLPARSVGLWNWLAAEFQDVAKASLYSLQMFGRQRSQASFQTLFGYGSNLIGHRNYVAATTANGH
jgi:hypothetical protein